MIPLAEADARCGAKAAGLAKLIAAGLPVPDGFVIPADVFRGVVGDLSIEGHDLEQAARRIEAFDDDGRFGAARALGARIVARSSTSVEDTAHRSGAGIFESVVDVTDVLPAIRSVWLSAMTPIAFAYARGRPIEVAVIIQRFVEGERVVVYTGDIVRVQRGGAVRDYARDADDPIVKMALRAEAVIGTPADIELVDGEQLWVVQARPIVPPPPTPKRMPPPSILLAGLHADGRVWTWDVAHNPDPLSPAQASLVERVERAQVAPWSLRVVAGFLYTAPRCEPAHDDTGDANAIEARFAEILDVHEPSVEVAVERYIAWYRVWSTELVPLIRNARRGVTSVGARPSAVEATLLAAARREIDEATAIERLGVLAPAWDVAVPTFGERPDVIRAAIARASPTSFQTLAPDPVADLAERDDFWFARAQALVRFALLRHGRERGIADDDICWLSLDDLDVSPVDAHRRASAAKAAVARASAWEMPLVVNAPAAEARASLRGFGSGARVSGRVVRFESLASAALVGHGDIIVTRAITPALAVFVVGCAAIISETGGPLDHGAAIARELGVPFIVGCKDAWSLLHDGMIVTIDRDVVTVS